MGLETSTGVTECREIGVSEEKGGGAERTEGRVCLALWRGYSSYKDTHGPLGPRRSTAPMRVPAHVTTCHCGPAWTCTVVLWSHKRVMCSRGKCTSVKNPARHVWTSCFSSRKLSGL